MDENQEQFISWIAAKLDAADENDLQSKLQELGDEGIKQAYDQFLQESSVATRKDGGKLEYIKCLQEFKKGGKMCGCGGTLNLAKKDKGGKLSRSYQGKAVTGSTPKKVKMGQGADLVLGGQPTLKRQEGGALPNAKPTQSPSKQASQKGGNTNQQNGMQQGPTPEQIQEQKVDEKASQLLNKKLGQGDPTTSPMDQLKMLLKPKQIKAPKEKTMRLFVKNGQYFGIEK